MTLALPASGRRTRVVAAALGIPFLAGLAFLTLTPTRVEERLPNLVDVVLRGFHRIGWDFVDFTRLEIAANVGVFVPVGILAFLLMPRRIWAVALLVGPVLSVMIELTQLVVLTHRAATLTDVIANSAGATIGVLLALICTLLFTSRTPRPSTLEA